MQSTGEEATQLGVAYALRQTDWIYPSYREPGIAFFRGYSIHDFTNQLFGNAEDPIKGRQMPVHHSFRAGNFVSISSPVGTQIPQAVGTARAAQILKHDTVTSVFWRRHDLARRLPRRTQLCGRLESAGHLRLPQQRLGDFDPDFRADRVPTIAHKALGYGFPGFLVDGNDILAMISATRIALRRGAGRGRSDAHRSADLSSAAHSSSDDPSVYRKGKDDEIKEWERRDPVARFARYLERRGILTPAIDAQYRDEITTRDKRRAGLHRARRNAAAHVAD